MAQRKSFDKFGWISAVLADGKLTADQRLFAVAFAIHKTWRDGKGRLVSLVELAALVPGGMSDNRLRIALRVLVDRGYLVQTERQGGGRHQIARRAHNLVAQPETLAEAPKPDPALEGVSGKTLSSAAQNPLQRCTKPDPALHNKTAADVEEGASQGIKSKGVKKGTRREEIRRAIDACLECDDYGRLDDDLTDCPRHANLRTAGI